MWGLRKPYSEKWGSDPSSFFPPPRPTPVAVADCDFQLERAVGRFRIHETWVLSAGTQV